MKANNAVKKDVTEVQMNPVVTPTTTTSFCLWLIRQRERGDVVGWLARQCDDVFAEEGMLDHFDRDEVFLNWLHDDGDEDNEEMLERIDVAWCEYLEAKHLV